MKIKRSNKIPTCSGMYFYMFNGHLHLVLVEKVPNHHGWFEYVGDNGPQLNLELTDPSHWSEEIEFEQTKDDSIIAGQLHKSK